MNKLIRSSTLIAGLLGVVAAPALFAAEKMGTVSIQLPKETAKLKPGPGVATASKYCMECHSVDYIYMQPPLTKEQWHGEVAKMKKAMGAPIQEEDIGVIVDYLMSQNGKP